MGGHGRLGRGGRTGGVSWACRSMRRPSAFCCAIGPQQRGKKGGGVSVRTRTERTRRVPPGAVGIGAAFGCSVQAGWQLGRLRRSAPGRVARAGKPAALRDRWTSGSVTRGRGRTRCGGPAEGESTLVQGGATDGQTDGTAGHLGGRRPTSPVSGARPKKVVSEVSRIGRKRWTPAARTASARRPSRTDAGPPGLHPPAAPSAPCRCAWPAPG